MSQHESTLTAQTPPATDEQVALRARELYAQYAQHAESARVAETGAKGTRRRAPRKSARARAAHPGDAAMPNHDDIALRAYMLFEQAGRPQGRDVEFWLEAERQLTGTPDA